MKRDELTALADELRLLVDEYDTQNSDWSFRKAVIHGVIDRLASRQAKPYGYVAEYCGQWLFFDGATDIDTMNFYKSLCEVVPVYTAPPATDAVREALIELRQAFVRAWGFEPGPDNTIYRPILDRVDAALAQRGGMSSDGPAQLSTLRGESADEQERPPGPSETNDDPETISSVQMDAIERAAVAGRPLSAVPSDPIPSDPVSVEEVALALGNKERMRKGFGWQRTREKARALIGRYEIRRR